MEAQLLCSEADLGRLGVSVSVSLRTFFFFFFLAVPGVPPSVQSVMPLSPCPGSRPAPGSTPGSPGFSCLFPVPSVPCFGTASIGLASLSQLPFRSQPGFGREGLHGEHRGGGHEELFLRTA